MQVWKFGLFLLLFAQSLALEEEEEEEEETGLCVYENMTHSDSNKRLNLRKKNVLHANLLIPLLRNFTKVALLKWC